jgi:hypothetical protein
MPWNNKVGYAFTEASINTNAPASSGVYAIYNSQEWIYFGESQNIRDRLLQHLAETGTCIKRHNPSGFSFESVIGANRVARQDALILDPGSACNKRFG